MRPFKSFVDYLKAASSHFGKCWRCSRHHWVVTVIAIVLLFYNWWITYAEAFFEVPHIHFSRHPIAWALAIIFAALFFIALEGSRQLLRDEAEKHKAELQTQSELHAKELAERDSKIAERDAQIADLLSTKNGPQVYLSYEYSLKEWSKMTSVNEAAIAHQMSQPIKIFNDGENVAFNVEIESLRHDKFTAKFKALPQISPHGGHYYIQPTIYEYDKERPEPWNQAFARMFVGILESPKPDPSWIDTRMGVRYRKIGETTTEAQIVPIPDWSTPPEGDVPVVIRYHEASGKRRFIGRCEVHYNRDDCTVKIKQLGIEAVRDN